MKIIPIILLLFSSASFGWECADPRQPGSIEEFWNERPLVVVAQVISGKYDQNSKEEYQYVVAVKHVLKGSAEKSLSIQGDFSLQLKMSEQYIFFVKNNKIDFCDLVLPFSYSWLERPDIPVERARVEKVVELSGYKP
uniref:hypothetical protein n=1 Tax=Microbulbifer agarilyticus TaxID=260552 RepID=UPI0002558E36|nr:hypothetical protein [Microbulbifer agarilyticus]